MARSPAVALPATGCRRLLLLLPPLRRRPLPCRFPVPLACPHGVTIKASSSAPPQGYIGPKPRKDLVRDWLSKNDALIRSLPIYVGGLSLLAVLLNRTLSGIAPVADASSSQSRADILTLSLAVTNVLAGLVWLSIRPKNISPVVPSGIECRHINPDIAYPAVVELLWAWDSLKATTCCRSFVVVYGSICLLQIGVAAESPTNQGYAVDVDVHKLIEGSLYRSIMESGKQTYLANLSLYPGRTQLPFLPNDTQAVILQPLGDKGIAIIGGDTIRGFTNLDQAWISLFGEKLDSTLSKS